MGSLRDLRKNTEVIEKPFRVTRLNRFNRYFKEFFEGAQRIVDDYYQGTRSDSDTLSVQKCRGRDLARIVSTTSYDYKFPWCFVDLKTGDVLRVETWKEPGRPRGNIFDEFHGLSRVGVRGPMYRGRRKH